VSEQSVEGCKKKRLRYVEIPTRRLNLLMSTIIKAVLGGASPANRKEQCSVGTIGLNTVGIVLCFELLLLLRETVLESRLVPLVPWYQHQALERTIVCTSIAHHHLRA